MPASNPAPAIPSARLLPHVLDATAHAWHLRAAPAAVVQLLQAVGADLLSTGQLDTARPLLIRALTIAQEDLGPDYPSTLTVRGHLASMLGAAGQPAHAAEQLRDLLLDFLRVLGPDHPDTLTARAHLAYWLGEAGLPDQAADQLRDLLGDYLRVLGPDRSWWFIRDTPRCARSGARWW